MSDSIIYDCYAYFSINQPHNTYPIRNPECHLEQILSLQKGDVLYIKGKGYLQVTNLYVTDYDYTDKGEDGLYQEIGVACVEIEY